MPYVHIVQFAGFKIEGITNIEHGAMSTVCGKLLPDNKVKQWLK